MDLFLAFFQLFKLDFVNFVYHLNEVPIFLSWFIFLLFCLLIILLLLKIFGEVGIFIYTVVAIIAANIQVRLQYQVGEQKQLPRKLVRGVTARRWLDWWLWEGLAIKGAKTNPTG